MKQLLLILAAFVIAFGGLEGAKKRYIVKYKELKAEKKAKMKANKKLLKEMKKALVVELEEGEVSEVLLTDPDVEAIEPDVLFHIPDTKAEQFTLSNFDSLASETTPPGVKRIGGEICGEIQGTVAVIDTGIDSRHPDLNVIKGINFLDPAQSSNDDNGHGTHVAGTIGAKCNGIGVVGVAPGAKLIALKVLSASGSGYLSAILDAIDWVAEHASEVDVVNMSLGMEGESAMLHAAIQRAVAKGVVFVVAAGNDARDIFGDSKDYFVGPNMIPAAFPEVMTISAMADYDGKTGGFGGYDDDAFAIFTNFSTRAHPDNPVFSSGAGIDLAAPGVDILSTWPGGGYKSISGTSMASPHAAGGVVRMMADYGRDFNGDGIRNSQDVWAIRQAMIDKGEPQSAWRAGKTRDYDVNPENLLRL